MALAVRHRWRCRPAPIAPTAPDRHLEARRQIAGELVARGDWQPAFGYVDQLHREQPSDPRILVLRATIYRERDLLTEAEADLREALRLDAQLSAAHAALGILLDLQRRAARRRGTAPRGREAGAA